MDAGKLHDVLDSYSVSNSFEIYPGTHTSAVADRFQNYVLPFFSKNLCFTANASRPSGRANAWREHGEKPLCIATPNRLESLFSSAAQWR